MPVTPRDIPLHRHPRQENLAEQRPLLGEAILSLLREREKLAEVGLMVVEPAGLEGEMVGVEQRDLSGVEHHRIVGSGCAGGGHRGEPFAEQLRSLVGDAPLRERRGQFELGLGKLDLLPRGRFQEGYDPAAGFLGLVDSA